MGYVRNLPQEAKRCFALSSPYSLLAISPIDQGPPCPKVNQARQGPSSWIQEQARICHLPHCYASGWSQTTCPQGCPYVQTQDFRWCQTTKPVRNLQSIAEERVGRRV